MRIGIIKNTLASVGIVEIIEFGGIVLEVFEGFLFHNLECNPYTEFTTGMFEKKRFI